MSGNFKVLAELRLEQKRKKIVSLEIFIPQMFPSFFTEVTWHEKSRKKAWQLDEEIAFYLCLFR